MARFETFTVGSQFIVLPKGLKFEYPGEPETNYIDKLVAAKLKKLRIAPSGHLRRRDVPPPGLSSTSSACRRPSRNTSDSWRRPPPTSGRS